MKFAFYVSATVGAVAAFFFAVKFGSEGRMTIWLVPIVVSPVGMMVVRLIFEDESVLKMFDLRTQSWAFLLGDSLVLPLAFGASAVSWRSIGAESWFRSPVWLVAGVIFGIAFACVWHFVLETPGYQSVGYADLLGSPTKIWHDFTVYASLSGGLFYLGIPALVKDFTGAGWVAFAGFVAWAILGVVVDNLMRDLDPADLHPRMQGTAIHK